MKQICADVLVLCRGEKKKAAAMKTERTSVRRNSWCHENPELAVKKISYSFIYIKPLLLPPEFADVAKLADALDLGSSAARRVGSTPSIRTL